jgi:hypothetical protein
MPQDNFGVLPVAMLIKRSKFKQVAAFTRDVLSSMTVDVLTALHDRQLFPLSKRQSAIASLSLFAYSMGIQVASDYNDDEEEDSFKNEPLCLSYSNGDGSKRRRANWSMFNDLIKYPGVVARVHFNYSDTSVVPSEHEGLEGPFVEDLPVFGWFLYLIQCKCQPEWFKSYFHDFVGHVSFDFNRTICGEFPVVILLQVDWVYYALAVAHRLTITADSCLLHRLMMVMGPMNFVALRPLLEMCVQAGLNHTTRGTKGFYKGKTPLHCASSPLLSWGFFCFSHMGTGSFMYSS